MNNFRGNEKDAKKEILNSKYKISFNRGVYSFSFLCFVAVFVWVSYFLKLDEKITYIIIFVFILGFGAFVIYFPKYEIKKYFVKRFRQLNIPIKIIRIKNKQIIEGKKFRLGNVRKNNIFCFEIKKYSCTFNNYYLERFERVIEQTTDNKNALSYKYIKLKNIMQYSYDLKNNVSDKISSEMLLVDDVRKNLAELSKDRIFDICIDNSILIIKKETIFEDYSIEYAERDINDIKIFYDKLVNLIKRLKISEEIKNTADKVNK